MPRPLNFLHLTTFYPPYSFGGDAMHVQRLANALGDQGHLVDVVHCIDSFRLAGLPPGPPPSQHPNVTVHSLRSPFGPFSPLLSHQTGRPLLQKGSLENLLRARRFDVIHFHNISLFGPGVLELDCPEAIKLYTTHEYWLICPTHVLWKFGRELCQHPECLQCVLRAKRPPQLWRYTGLIQHAARHVDQFLSPSRFTAAMHAERGFHAPFEHLPNFCDRSDADWSRPGPRPGDRPYFLYVGRLETIKGPQTILPLWEKIAGPALLLAGSGREAKQLHAMAAANPAIRFLGHVTQGELGSLYANAEALIVPSLTYEIFPLVVVEALARKTPVIARDLGGLAEVVLESGGGLVYRTDQDLLGCVRRLVSDPELRNEFGEQGYRHFIAHWTREAHLERYAEILRDVARRKFGRVPWEDD